LRELGLSLSSPIVDVLSVRGPFQYIPLKYKIERVEKIAQTLKELGASKAAIDDVCSTMYIRVTGDHMRNILRNLSAANPGKEALFEGMQDGNMDDWDQSALDEFIKENSLVVDKETQECIEDREYFLKNKRIRRDDKWQG
jgi:hypothetical protein